MKLVNGLAVRLNRSIAQSLHLAKGTKVNIEVDKKGIHITPIKTRKSSIKLPFSEDALLADITPHLSHTDELAIPLLSEVGE